MENSNKCFIMKYQEYIYNPKKSSPVLGTQTVTEAREEPDQDISNEIKLTGTETATFTREEVDSDVATLDGYNVIPKLSYQTKETLGTQTKTATIEEPDQDRNNNNFNVLPINDSCSIK